MDADMESVGSDEGELLALIRSEPVVVETEAEARQSLLEKLVRFPHCAPLCCTKKIAAI